MITKLGVPRMGFSRNQALWTRVLPTPLTSASWNFPGSGAARTRFSWDEMILGPGDSRIMCCQEQLFLESGSPGIRLSQLLSLPFPGWNFPLVTLPRGKEQSPGLGKEPWRVLGTGGRVRTMSLDLREEGRVVTPYVLPLPVSP